MNHSANIADFIRARLAEEEQHIDLFHEPSCPHAASIAGQPTSRRRCRCKVPARLQEQFAIKHQIVNDCERTIDNSRPCWLTHDT